VTRPIQFGTGLLVVSEVCVVVHEMHGKVAHPPPNLLQPALAGFSVLNLIQHISTNVKTSHTISQEFHFDFFLRESKNTVEKLEQDNFRKQSKQSTTQKHNENCKEARHLGKTKRNTKPTSAFLHYAASTSFPSTTCTHSHILMDDAKINQSPSKPFIGIRPAWISTLIQALLSKGFDTKKKKTKTKTLSDAQCP
jgi:hypothetical protein